MKYYWRIVLFGVVLGFGIGIFHAPIMRAVTASFDMTVQIVSSTGTVLGGVASATSASFDRTVRVVDSTGKVLDQVGASSTIYPNTAPSAAQILVGNAGGTAYAPVSLSQDCTLASTGAITCTKTNNVAFTALATATVPLSLANGGTNQTTGATSFCMGTTASIAATTTDFIACGDDAAVALLTTEANAQQMIPTACAVSNLQVTLTTAANANKPVITVDKNAVGTTLTCTVNDALGEDTTTHCADTTHTFTTTGAAGAKDLLSIKVANPAGANATGVMQVAFNLNC